MVLGCNKNVTPVKENDRERVFGYRQQAVVWGKRVFWGVAGKRYGLERIFSWGKQAAREKKTEGMIGDVLSEGVGIFFSKLQRDFESLA